jgi:manganese/iron transport system permease protein
MIDTLLEPFSYGYMTSAILVSTIVGGLCAFLSAYLMLKGWSLIGDALAHSVVPGVAGAYLLGLPFAIGAFISGGLAASLMLFLSERSGLKTDVVIGIIFTAFFGVGLFVVSLYPMSISIETIIMGNILAISYSDMLQLLIIGSISLVILFLKWRDLMVVFFDESHARTVGLSPSRLKIVFFTLLSASIVAALQTVGAFLVIAMIVTPGATAYLICDRFPKLILLSVLIGSVTCFTGAYLSFFIDGATGGIIVVLQTIVFLGVFLIAPKYGYISARLKIRQANKRIENGF